MTKRTGRGEIGKPDWFYSVADYNVLPVVLREFCRAHLTWRRGDDLPALRVFVDAGRIANLPR